MRQRLRLRHVVAPMLAPPAAFPVVLPARPLNLLWRWLLLAFAVCCLALGVIGIFVPGLPTTVFIIMAAWAAARSSPRFLAWLEAHRVLGPTLLNWRAGRYVSRRAKLSAALTMALSAALLFWMAPRPWLAEAVTLFMAAVLVWLWRRPEPPVR